MPKVSIIIPVYNTARYIRKCLDSVLGQTFTDFEALLVDDGSTDGSGAVCDEYAARDSRFRVFHKANGGVSSARNLGLDNAQGEWITFIDADDWIESETLEACLASCGDAECLRFQTRSVVGGNVCRENHYENDSWNNDVYLLNVILRQTALGVVGGLYRRSVFVDNNIEFNPKYTLGEDWLVLVQYLKCIDKICIVNRPLYNYNKLNETSATATPTLSKLLALNEVTSLICHDNDLVGRFGDNIMDILKARVCAQILACVISFRPKMSVYLRVVRDMASKDIYPSVRGIFHSKMFIRSQLVLLLFLPLNCYYQFFKR